MSTLAIGISMVPGHPRSIDMVREAESMGVDAIWAAEFWAGDVFTPLAFAAAHTQRVRLITGIAQLGARTPAMLAMSAMSLQQLSGGRCVLGIGVSGPQVMEGWHGVSFDRPLQRTRETIEILRLIGAGERLRYDGSIYQLPVAGGEGRPIRSMMGPITVPIFVASLGPANLRLTGELADGWIGNSFFPETAHVFTDAIAEGAATAGRSMDDIELTVAVGLELTDDVDEAARRHAEGYAFTFGAMGSPTTNFYNEAFARQGYGDDVAEVQRLWIAGDRAAARARVPHEIGLGTNLVGTADMIIDRLLAYRRAGISALRVGLPGSLDGDGFDHQIDQLGQLLDLVAQANRRPIA